MLDSLPLDSSKQNPVHRFALPFPGNVKAKKLAVFQLKNGEKKDYVDSILKIASWDKKIWAISFRV